MEGAGRKYAGRRARRRNHRHPRQPAGARSGPRGRSRRPASRRSGASATWSATGSSPTPAPTWCASAATSAWSATTTSRCWASLDIASFSEAAAVAVEWTRDNVAERTLEFLRELEPSGEREGIGLFHASPRDPVWEYVLSGEQADAGMDANPQRIGLIGHSHVALFFTRPDGRAGRDPRRPGQRRRPARPRQRRLAGQSRQRRPAPRRRPARRLAGARHRGARRPASTASPTRSSAPPRRSPRPACRAASPTASTPASDAQMQGKSAPEAVL